MCHPVTEPTWGTRRPMGPSSASLRPTLLPFSLSLSLRLSIPPDLFSSEILLRVPLPINKQRTLIGTGVRITNFSRFVEDSVHLLRRTLTRSRLLERSLVDDQSSLVNFYPRFNGNPLGDRATTWTRSSSSGPRLICSER